MFKGILSALRGTKTGRAATKPQLHCREQITVYDAYGREIKIARDEWRDKAFLPNLRQKWNDPDELSSLIISGLNDGFATDLMPAAARLIEIDSNYERSHTVQGIVLMKNGHLDAAEAALRAGIAKAGETGTLLTNLAKVFAERGEQARADDTLWRAIQADPNQDNGMLWWAAIERDRRGEAGYIEALRTVAALPGSWLAQLWLARHHLEHNEVASARALYAEVLAANMFNGSALMMISGDLGNNGHIALAVELLGPVYDEHKHGPVAGLNLLRAYQELGKVDDGERLLSRMYPLGIVAIKQHLDNFAQVFQEMRRQAAHGTPIDPEALQIRTLVLSQPIWHYGLRDADWLFAPKPDGAPEVGFFALSKMMDGSERAESQREDELGRFTRAIPLYLAEAAHYWSDHAARCYIQVVEGGGPVVSGCEADANALFDIVPPAMEYFVTGALGCSGTGEQSEWRISLSLWHCATRTRLAVESGSAVQAGLGELLLGLETRLLARIGPQREQPVDAFYVHPTAAVMPAYLAELGQALMLTLAANGQVSKSSMWGERAMLDWPLNMALQWPTVEVPKLMYISGLGKAFEYKSDVLGEYKERSLQLLREAEQASSPAFRLAPLAWKVFGMEEELLAFVRKLPADANPAFKAWLERVRE